MREKEFHQAVFGGADIDRDVADQYPVLLGDQADTADLDASVNPAPTITIKRGAVRLTVAMDGLFHLRED
jgi:hypothetical protein